MRKPDFRTLGVVAVTALALMVAGCGDDDDDGGGGGGQDGAGIETVRPGTLIVGSDIPFPPFEQGRAPDYEGFDIDLAREIATRLDLELQVEDTPFDTIFRDLSQDKFDMVASATTITPERENTVDFSDPYFLAEQSILVQEDSEVATVEDLAGLVVGAQNGTTGATYVKDETDAETVRTYGEADDAYNALAAGQIDAVVIDLVPAQEAAATKEGLEVVTSIDTGESYGLGLAEDSDPLRGAVNEALTEIKQDGTYEDLYREYFDTAPPAGIQDATHEAS